METEPQTSIRRVRE